MGSFPTTCFKSLSVHTLFSKSKASLTRENTKTRLSLLLCKDVFWASICSASILNLSCHAAWKHPFSAPTGLQVFTKARPQLKSKGNSMYWPVAVDVLAYSPGLASTSTHAALRASLLSLCRWRLVCSPWIPFSLGRKIFAEFWMVRTQSCLCTFHMWI